MADLNISSFLSSKVREFLSQFDTDKSGVIEKANGEYVAMQKALNGGKAEELGNVDTIILNNTSQANSPNGVSSDFDWDTVVNNYNNAGLTERENTRDNVTSYVQEKLDTVSQNIDVKVIKALTNPTIVSLDMYKHYMGPLAGGIRDTLNAIIDGFEKQFEEVRNSVRDEIREYDSRYATSRGTLGAYYIDNEDTRLLNDPMVCFIDIQADDAIVNDLCNMNEQERDLAIEAFQAQAYAKYSEQISELLHVAKNIVKEMSNNQKESLDSIDEVTAQGNLTHEVGLEHSLSLGLVQTDQFNISKKDPKTYYKFLDEVKTYDEATALTSISKDNEQAPMSDLSGKQIKGDLQKGKIYIQKGKKFIIQ